MQTMIPNFDSNYGTDPRPQSSLSTITDVSHQDTEQQSMPSPPLVVPNFSVPQGSIRRFSTAASPPRGNAPDKEVYSKSARRSPPPVLGISRPLSTVLDQSPISPLSSNSHSGLPSPIRQHFPGSPTHSMGSPRMNGSPKPAMRPYVHSRPARPSPLSPSTPNSTSPRKYSSTGNLRDSRRPVPLSPAEKSTFALSQATLPTPVEGEEILYVQRHMTPRTVSSMDNYQQPQKSPGITSPKVRNKRASFNADKPSFRYSLNSYVANPVHNVPLMEEPDPMPRPTRVEGRPSPPKVARTPFPRHHQAANPRPKVLLTSRSMPHLDVPPPPLPPPNRALPAIPKKGMQETPYKTSATVTRI